MSSILKTTTCEITFDGSTPLKLYFVAPGVIIPVPIYPTGPYSFEIVDERDRNKEILPHVFQMKYFIKVKDFEYRLTPAGIDEVENNWIKMKKAIETMQFKDTSEMFIMSLNKSGMASATTGMSSLTMVRILGDIMQKDPNVQAAVEMMFNEWVMEKSKGLMEHMLLDLMPRNDTPN